MIRPHRATAILLRLRARRLWNSWAGRLGKRRGARSGTPGKRRAGGLFPALVTVWLIFGSVFLGFSIHDGLEKTLFGAAALARGEAFVVFLMWCYALLLTVADSELTKADWDLEFLVTLPVRLPVLLGIRLAERTLICPAGYLAVFPFLVARQWLNHRRGWAVPLAFLEVLPLNACLAAAQTVIDTGLRLRLGPARLRNLRALGQVAGIAFLYLVLSQGQGHSFVAELSTYLPDWYRWTPFALAATRGGDALALLGIESVLVIGLALIWLRRALRSGVAAQGERESGRRDRPAATVSEKVGPLALRELRLLRRDRSFLVQTLLLPLIIVGFQAANGRRGLNLMHLDQHPGVLAATAFAIAAYALMFSAFQTLNAEGEAIWILYCLPLPLERVLRRKAIFWGRWALVYPALFFTGYFAIGGRWNGEALTAIALTLYGIFVYTAIATALGIFACDPLAPKIERRIRPGFVYLYLGLVSLYVYGMIAATRWQTLALTVLSGALGAALWQKAKDGLPYLLDTAAQPPEQVSVADGMIAAFFFFMAQGIAFLIWREHHSAHVSLIFSYGTSGLITYAAARAIFWKNGTQNVPKIFSRHWPRDLAFGLAGGVLAATWLPLYLRLIHRFGWFRGYWNSPTLSPAEWRTFALLAIVGAPLAEEFLFRGLIFGGLRRTWRWPLAALASAALFAVVHPPPSLVPVFVVGCVTAALYQRTERLGAGMIAHAAYNALALWWMR